MRKFILGTFFMLTPIFGSAEVLLIDEVRLVDRRALPSNGQSKLNVENSFGAPSKRYEAVGEPPITRWDYDNYSVYFEGDLVLFTVLTGGQPVEQG